MKIYTLVIRKNDGTVSRIDYAESRIIDMCMKAMQVDDCGTPWYVIDLDEPNKMMRYGNLDRIPPKNDDPTPAEKAGVALSCDTEPELPDIDVDTALDEVNNVIDNLDVADDAKKLAPEQTVDEEAELDLIEDAAFLDQDADGLYHIIRVDHRVADNYIDMRYATKEKAATHFIKLKKANVAMIAFTVPESIDAWQPKSVKVFSYNFNKANKKQALNALFHIFSMRQEHCKFDVALSNELESMMDSFLKSFMPESGYFDVKPYEICVDNHTYFIKDEYMRDETFGNTEKEEWRYLYDSKEAVANSCDPIYSLCIADNM